MKSFSGFGSSLENAAKANADALSLVDNRVQKYSNGDEKLYELLQNMDENTKVVLVSKASYDIMEKGLNFLNRNK